MIFVFASAIIHVFAIYIYKRTVIDWEIIFSIWLLIGIISQRFTSSFLDIYLKTTNYFMQLFFNVCSYGGLMALCFLATNYYFNIYSQTEKHTTPLINSGYHAKARYGCPHPYAYVIIFNTVKELVFSCDIEIEKYKFVKLTTEKGLFGFYIITNKELVEKKSSGDN